MNKFRALEQLIAYRFRKKSLLTTALTHPSFRYENPDVSEDNQRLEFLGDAVLGMLASDMLMAQYPDAAEGELTRLKSSLISGIALASAARTIGLGKHLQLGKGEAANRGANRDSNLEDVLESLLGAVWLDGGLRAARRFFDRNILRVLKTIEPKTDNPKGTLQEYAQKNGYPIPMYRILKESGPAHAKRYYVEVAISSYAYQGEGNNRREAEKNAAEKAISNLFIGV